METKRANRQVCDVDFRDLKTKKPFMFFEDGNTTSLEITADSTYAMSKGAKKIAFSNPMDSTVTIECQVAPFRMYALMSDGVVESSATYADIQVITASTAGSLTVTVPSNGTIVAGTVFVYPEGDVGVESELIAGSFASPTFTATTSSQIAAGSKYAVTYMVTRTAGVQRISFNNDRLPNDFYVTMKTVDKAEDGTLTPFLITLYKATPQRNVSMSFSSDGDPATLTITLDCMEDADGNQVDFVEITDETTAMAVSESTLSVAQGANTANVAITGAVGTVTAAVKDSENATYAKLHAYVSGDNDTVIIAADADATAGTYTVTLTDSTATTPQTATISVTVTAAAA